MAFGTIPTGPSPTSTPLSRLGGGRDTDGRVQGTGDGDNLGPAGALGPSVWQSRAAVTLSGSMAGLHGSGGIGSL